MSFLAKWFSFGGNDLYSAGIHAHDHGEYARAIEILERCLNEDPEPDTARLAKFYIAESYAQLGVKHQREGQHGLAINDLNMALRTLPHYPDLNLAIAKAYWALGQYPPAERHIDRALILNPRYADALVFRAAWRYEAGDHDAALRDLDAALSVEPSLNGECYKELRELHATADHVGALTRFHLLSASRSDDANAHLSLGDQLLREERVEDALEHYREALEIAPHYADLHCRYGAALVRLDRTEEAILHLERALQINKNYADARALLEQARERADSVVPGSCG